MNPGKQITATRQAVLSWLSRLAPFGSLAELLGIPDSLYELGDSFSTNPTVAASYVNGFFFLNLPMDR